MNRALSLFTVVSLLAGSYTCAHPGAEDHASELAQRAEYLSATARSLAACANSPEYLAVRDAAIKRRSEFLAHLRRRAMDRRDLNTALNTNHKSNLTGLTSATDPAKLFGTTPKCLLAPETTAGPYFVSGEVIRKNIVDGQAGLPVYLDLQFIDSKTCKVVPNLYINVWHANSTGVYSGVVASGNGNSADTSNVYKTNHRGIYPTDASGVVQFTTTFPGHYTGRATHIHLATASGGTVLANNTYSNPVYSHVGQVFFDQSLITAVEKLSPYSSNAQPITTNAQDGIVASAAASTFDPFLNYAYINDNLNSGILAWVSIAIDTSQTVTVTPAVVYAGDKTSTTPVTGGEGPGTQPSGNPATGSPTASPSKAANPRPSGANNLPSPSTTASRSPVGAPPAPTPSAMLPVGILPPQPNDSNPNTTPNPSNGNSGSSGSSGSGTNTSGGVNQAASDASSLNPTSGLFSILLVGGLFFL